MSVNERVFFVNPTLMCNINCPRCFLTQENRSRKDIIKDEHLIDVMTHSFFKNHEEVTVIMEGGEPVVLGEKYMNHFMNMVSEYLPQAKKRIVTNLFSAPDWLIEISKKHCDYELETTFALGKKETLKGSEDDYLRRFKKNLKKVVDNGVNIHVNVETNKETIGKGSKEIIEIAKETGCKSWEFDISVDFESFHKKPLYNSLNHPILETTTTYKELSDFIYDFMIRNKHEIDRLGLTNFMMKDDETIRDNSFFNVSRNNDFITINPNGDITTNPLLSNVNGSMLGNLSVDTFDECLRSIVRRNITRHEVKRIFECDGCEFFNQCRGGSSHVPLFDGSGECAGMKEVWKAREQYIKEEL